MLSITKINVESKEGKILAEVVDCNVPLGTISLIVGKNGSGKTSFLNGIFMHPHTRTPVRELFLDQENISVYSSVQLFECGMYYVPQHLTPLPGVSFLSFLHVAYETKYALKISLLKFATQVKEVCRTYGLHEYLVEKNVHEGLSGGERKVQELIQILVLKPRYIFLDEIDAGLDRDARVLVAKVIMVLKKENYGIVLISHSFEFAQSIEIDTVYIMNEGKVIQQGDSTLLLHVQKVGFEEKK